MTSAFKRTFCWKDMKINFVGVWDAVSSVGLVKEDVFLSSSSSAEHAFAISGTPLLWMSGRSNSYRSTSTR
ncbi:hypothetical protein PAXRUDRAFT_606781 [Paxillus rubicundulus Ve08.2h10]|uniref:DUF2235 domain-containing protein n=1 Tax=Paxillus rubicundulus Ve08.2h10 TaxID=930991 RepID=A0A0D0DTK7_9AGAM|nr:hypothetical protein PAXRUDRAFT_606781 [Paxillus rubicundulus Ve08.2h10]